MYDEERGKTYKDPVEREAEVKNKIWRKFYYIDIKPGDLVQYDIGTEIYYGLVVETEQKLNIAGGTRTVGKVLWSTDNKPEEQEWYNFNSKNWLVLSR